MTLGESKEKGRKNDRGYLFISQKEGKMSKSNPDQNSKTKRGWKRRSLMVTRQLSFRRKLVGILVLEKKEGKTIGE